MSEDAIAIDYAIRRHERTKHGAQPEPTLSRRDAFAAAALSGMLASKGGFIDPASAGVRAVAFADALLAALDARQEGPSKEPEQPKEGTNK